MKSPTLQRSLRICLALAGVLLFGPALLAQTLYLVVPDTSYEPGGYALYNRLGVVVGGGNPNGVTDNGDGTKTIEYNYHTYPAAIEGQLVSYGFAWDPDNGGPSPFDGGNSDLVALGDGTVLTNLPFNYIPTIPPEFIDNSLIVEGHLDVNGQYFSLGTNQQNPSVPGTTWVYDSDPSSGGGFLDRLHSQLAASNGNYEWVWEIPNGTGGWNKLMSLRSYPTPGLRLEVPITVSGATVLTTTSGDQDYVRRDAPSVAFGSGTVTRSPQPVGQQSGQLVLGKYNDTGNLNGGDHKQGVLIVGTGTGTLSSQRSNGLRILDDGTVLILPKGDIGMGNFTGGPQP